MRSDVEQALEKFNIMTFGSKYNIEQAQSILKDNETVLLVTPTNFNTNSHSKTTPAIAILTDKRIFFYHCRGFGQSGLDVIPLNEIRSISYIDKGLEGDRIFIYTLTKSYSFFVLNKKGTIYQVYEEFETAVNNYKSQQAAQNSHTQPNTPQPDIADQIEKLAQLRDKGILTEEEFQAKKTDLLSRM